ncbi:MAG: hypothetical protein ACRDHP_00710 [Ktedonobacterales bacterium]
MEHHQPPRATPREPDRPDTLPARPITCPFCRSTNTEPMSLFGSQLSTAQYYCRACHTPFERMKQEPTSGDS